jgi:peptidoglycan/xylan/chitin deacetylase (PgdA/CDA1 family)
MKKMLSLALILCLLLPAAAMGEDTLPKVKFPAANCLGTLDKECVISLETVNAGSFTGSKMLELRDRYNRLLGTREYKLGQNIYFVLQFDESFLGGYDLSVWCEGKQISVNSAYLAVADSHRKAVVKAETPENWMSIAIYCDAEGDNTDAILDVLAQNDVKATFFLSGSFVLSFPESAQKIKAAGHEIGSGTWTAPRLMEQGQDVRFSQVRKGNQIIREKLGVIPRLFMSPYGEVDITISGPARAEGMEVVVGTIDSRDWDEKTANDPDAVIKRATAQVESGAIVLFHVDGFNTAQVIAGALPVYRDTLNLAVVPVGELIASAGIELPPCPYQETRVRVTQNVF